MLVSGYSELPLIWSGADPGILRGGGGAAEFSSKKGGGGPTTYSGQFVLEINKILITGWPHFRGPAVTTMHVACTKSEKGHTSQSADVQSSYTNNAYGGRHPPLQ